MSRVALLDACVLVPYTVANVLLELAHHGALRPLWSATILAETQRALRRKIGVPARNVDRRITAMRQAFPDAEVVGFEPLLDDLMCHPKDRHVLAAAIHGGAGTVVTNNLKDFPHGACRPFGIAALSPDEFMCDLFAQDQSRCYDAVRSVAQRSRRPSLDAREVTTALSRVTPRFSEALGWHDSTPEGLCKFHLPAPSWTAPSATSFAGVGRGFGILPT